MKKVNPLDAEKNEKQDKDSDIVKNIVSTEKDDRDEPMLEAPTADDELFKNLSKESPSVEEDRSLLQDVKPSKSLLLIMLKIIFGLLVGASVASFLFFTSQFTDYTADLGIPNISIDISASNEEIISLQTDLNFYKYLEAKGYLDEFSYYGDSFIQNYEISNSKTASSSEKKDAGTEMVKMRENMREPFLSASDKLKGPISADIVAVDISNGLERDALFIQELRAKLSANDDKNYLYALNLVGNGDLHSLLQQTDIDSLSDEELYELTKKINTLVVNDLSIIQQIKEDRIKWSDIISEIDHRTMIVDQYYSRDFYDEYGGIRYTSYDFDSQNKRITIVGETKRFDATNFTMIASLIDELNNSNLFNQAEMRSFSKSGSTDNGYTATIKITMYLEQ